MIYLIQNFTHVIYTLRMTCFDLFPQYIFINLQPQLTYNTH